MNMKKTVNNILLNLGDSLNSVVVYSKDNSKYSEKYIESSLRKISDASFKGLYDKKGNKINISLIQLNMDDIIKSRSSSQRYNAHFNEKEPFGAYDIEAFYFAFFKQFLDFAKNSPDYADSKMIEKLSKAEPLVRELVEAEEIKDYKSESGKNARAKLNDLKKRISLMSDDVYCFGKYTNSFVGKDNHIFSGNQLFFKDYQEWVSELNSEGKSKLITVINIEPTEYLSRANKFDKSILDFYAENVVYGEVCNQHHCGTSITLFKPMDTTTRKIGELYGSLYGFIHEAQKLMREGSLIIATKGLHAIDAIPNEESVAQSWMRVHKQTAVYNTNDKILNSITPYSSIDDIF